ncbi:hypothetical protein [Pseudomonas gingeri]|nr:hypothetical protein [Pseudomonas gingeri]NWD06346.1 hypothetical protein [Pseudomonas gingeri]NWE32815.1 hypothetical protein [Pseudomonas gingeri]NWE60428.1 hypothetical protein [Pseudomonas gingeri]NWF04998.1 hypothetical protein [Pseudomonas gingeri]
MAAAPVLTVTIRFLALKQSSLFIWIEGITGGNWSDIGKLNFGLLNKSTPILLIALSPPSTFGLRHQQPPNIKFSTSTLMT